MIIIFGYNVFTLKDRKNKSVKMKTANDFLCIDSGFIFNML